jgi:hypothetical protein
MDLARPEWVDGYNHIILTEQWKLEDVQKTLDACFRGKYGIKSVGELVTDMLFEKRQFRAIQSSINEIDA